MQKLGKRLMSVTIVTIARNENEHIEEFFIYYKKVLGATRVMFYDDSDDDIQKNICSYYPDLVTYIPWRGKGHVNSHIHALENCETEYIGFFDIDEFLSLHRHACLDNYVDEVFTPNVDIVYFNWRIFASMGYQNDPHDLVTSSYTQCLPPVNMRVDLENLKWRPHGIKKYIARARSVLSPNIHEAKVTGGAVYANDVENPSEEDLAPYREAGLRALKASDYSTVQLNHYQSKSLRSVIQRDLQGYGYNQENRVFSLDSGKRDSPFWRLGTLRAVNEFDLEKDEFMLQYRDRIQNHIRVGYRDTFETVPDVELPDLSLYNLSPQEEDFVRRVLTERAVNTLEYISTT